MIKNLNLKWKITFVVTLVAIMFTMLAFQTVSSEASSNCRLEIYKPYIGRFETPLAEGGISNCTNGNYKVKVCLKVDRFLASDITVKCTKKRTVSGTYITKKSGCTTTGAYGMYFYTQVEVNGHEYQSERVHYTITSCRPPSYYPPR